MIRNESETVVRDLIDFAEENWHAFLARCAEKGIDEAAVEADIERLKEDVYE